VIAPSSLATGTADVEVHHEVPRCLLRLRDRADAAGLDGEGIQLWLDYELEAMRYGVDPDLSRDELAARIDASTVELPHDEHRTVHAGQWAEWGRRGGLETLRRYGRPYFSMLRRRRCGLDADELASYRAVQLAAKTGAA
jgi:hypothetical protein